MLDDLVQIKLKAIEYLCDLDQRHQQKARYPLEQAEQRVVVATELLKYILRVQGQQQPDLYRQANRTI